MNRTRDNSTSVDASWRVLETHSVSGVTQDRTGVHSAVQTDVMWDTVTRNYKKRSKAGEFIVNPMVKSKRKLTYLPSEVYLTASPPGGAIVQYRETGVVSPSVHKASSYDPMQDPVILTLVEKLEGEAITGAYAGVNSASWESLTDLVELKETLSFLYNPVSAMVKLTLRAADWLRYAERVYAQWQRRLRKWEKLPPRKRIGRNHNPPELPKLRPIRIGRFLVTDIPSFWLAMRYGLMPLMYSFQDIQQTFFEKANELVDRPKRMTSRKVARGKVSLSSPEEMSNGSYAGGTYQYVYFTDGETLVSARAGVTYIPDWSLTSQSGFEISRIPAALWEGIPLSFVADWFWNGAQVYDALTADFRALKILGSWCTTTVQYTAKSGLMMTPVQHMSTSGRVINVEASGEWKRRRHAMLSDIRFQMKLDLNSKRIVDGLSLIYLFLSTGKITRK